MVILTLGIIGGNSASIVSDREEYRGGVPVSRGQRVSGKELNRHRYVCI